MNVFKTNHKFTAIFVVLVIFLGVTLTVPTGAYGKEEILSFHSDMTIKPDGSMVVTETIKVRSEQNEIRRGIYRDLPLEFIEENGKKFDIDFRILDVKRNGQDESYHTEDRFRGIRVYFGKRDRFIEPGVHTYQFKYRVDRHLSFYRDHDELYWDVTGSNWSFPIKNATATVHLPDQISGDDIKVNGFTGEQGVSGQAYIVQKVSDGLAKLTTTRPLQPGEGFTIVVGWPPGRVKKNTREEIVSFRSKANVHENRSMTVTEQINIRAKGDDVKGGIRRELPLNYQDDEDYAYRPKIKVLEATRNDHSVPVSTKIESYGKVITIGNPDRDVPEQVYHYELRYRVEGAIRDVFPGDRLAWHVTGDHWTVPIQSATFTVNFPDTSASLQLKTDGFTGRRWEKNRHYESAFPEPGIVRFETTETLSPRQGLVAYVDIPNDVLNQPGPIQFAGMIIKDIWYRYSFTVVAVFGFLMLLVYYLVVWWKVGKDPNKGTIIPRYEAPEGISPAASRYLMNMGFDMQCFSSSITNMAVKGYLTIEEKDDTYTLSKTGDSKEPLSSGERRIAEELFSDGDTIKLDNTNHSDVQEAIQSLKTNLREGYKQKFFRTNSSYITVGILVSLIFWGMLLYGFTYFSTTAGITMGIAALLGFVTVYGAKDFRDAIDDYLDFKTVSLYQIAIGSGVFLGLIGFSTSFSVLYYLTLPSVSVLFLSFVALHVLFYFLLKAPTVVGSEHLTWIEGFQLYLSTAEKNRLNSADVPEKTPELFESFLPYAMALDVEDEWANSFTEVFQNLKNTEGHAYKPHWYRGEYFDATQVTPSLSENLTQSVTEASVDPTSSSGGGSFSSVSVSSSSGFSSGGGYSGGGVGGGGGGGW
ncbi:MAG: DUF2207 domain-containing protein [bacterium]